MNLILSVLYAPFVFYSLKNFDIKTVSLFILGFSLIWLLFTFKRGFREFFFPLVYLSIAILSFFLQKLFFLKTIPFLISFIITIYIFYSLLTKNSFIFYFLEKFNISIDEKEKKYIQKSTLFWLFFSIINMFIHLWILYIDNINYWTVYSSIGWYFVFLVAGIFQFLHRKIYFEKRKNV